MIKETIGFCEKLASEVGVEVKLTEPVKRLRRISIASNSAFGIGLFTVGVLLSSKILATVGVVSLVGAVVMATSNFGDKAQNTNDEVREYNHSKT